MQQNQSQNPMAVEPVPKLMARIGLPIVLSMILQAAYNVVDSAYLARMATGGETALTALCLAFPRNAYTGRSSHLCLSYTACALKQVLFREAPEHSALLQHLQNHAAYYSSQNVNRNKYSREYSPDRYSFRFWPIVLILRLQSA